MNYNVMPGLKEKPTVKINGDRVMQVTIKYFNVTEKQLRGKWRKRHVVLARHIICYILHLEYGMLVRDIGTLINRHYSSVIFWLCHYWRHD